MNFIEVSVTVIQLFLMSGNEAQVTWQEDGFMTVRHKQRGMSRSMLNFLE
jgi:hypothetical protein